ncbi:Cupin 1 [Lasiodiplodia theobromae]|uniref:Oxalate decarboxylase OxdD n=1 Tax=Lasiodiplodia theobromae TaxID=45133 RepID=A0A5N5D4C7_9PEZI|nr:Oxalate decarboxylase OxdD [Lasiodiplodia theobromae]KAF9632298.1 Cupin 1 [Lasiodiplodia theobromae]
MTTHNFFASLLAAALLLSPSACLPAPPQGSDPGQYSRSGATSGSSGADSPGPPGASGSLRGPAALRGFNPSSPLSLQSTVIPPEDFELGPGQSLDPKLGVYIDLSKVKNPQPIRGGTTASTDPGPRTEAYDRLNSDIFAPPGTDSGDVPNAKWPLGLSHNRLGLKSSGWARQQNVNQMPVAKAMAGVDMRLEPNAYRELHWHKQNEWALVLNGSVRIASMEQNGQSFIDDLQEGDVWFFPAGEPHSIQALANGCEFLLIFDDGTFSEDNTFLVSELFERNPLEVLAKNFRTNVDAFKNLPKGELYIFPGTPAPANISEQNSTGPAGSIPMEQSYSYHLSKQEPYRVPGGTVKIIDPKSFPIAKNFAAALFTVEPGAMRELHWHTTSDEWTYFISGQGRVTVYDAPEASATFDFSAGDVGYVPVPFSHYIENTGTEPLVYLEVLLADAYQDVSVAQWLGLTPAQVVKDHLGVDDEFIAKLPKTKQFILPGNKDLLETDFSDEQL